MPKNEPIINDSINVLANAALGILVFVLTFTFAFSFPFVDCGFDIISLLLSSILWNPWLSLKTLDISPLSIKTLVFSNSPFPFA